MYDNNRSVDYDPKNCLHLACSEVRAANLSGYCENDYSYFYAVVNQSWNKKYNIDCVKSKANEHLSNYYQHCEKDSRNYINKVWAKCYQDHSPIKDFSREKNFI